MEKRSVRELFTGGGRHYQMMRYICTFAFGLIIGGVSLFLLTRNDTRGKDGDAENACVDYAQVYGIDVSAWQGNVYWDQLRLPCEVDGSVSGKIPGPRYQRPVQFVFIRATKSDSLVDTLYHRNYNEAKRLSIPCGAYHFLTDTVSGKVQAELFLSHAQFEAGDLPPVLDVEIDAPGIVEKAKEWLAIVEESCGTKAIIYTNLNVYSKWINDDPMLGSRDLWLAQPRGAQPAASCVFWQFTHQGHVCGIIDNVVDINLFNGTSQDLQAYIDEKGIKE